MATGSAKTCPYGRSTRKASTHPNYRRSKNRNRNERITTSPSRSSGARTYETPASNQSLLIGLSSTVGATMLIMRIPLEADS